MPIHSDFFQRTILTGEVGQCDLVFGVQSRFISRSVQARLQVHVCAAVMICATLVNIQTHTERQTESILTSLYE